MLHFFRNMFKSKVGVAIALVFLGIIAIAFASADISGSNTFGGVAGGDRVAVVGKQKLGTADLTRAANSALDQVRAEQDPAATMATFLAQGGLNSVLDQLIDRTAMREYAEKYGLRAGTNLVNSEIRSIPAFRGADGNFSEQAYRQVLAQQRLTDAQVREDLSTSLLAKQLFIPVSFGTTLPESLAFRYAQLFKERRQGSIAFLPAAAFATASVPSDAQLKAFYDTNTSLFVRPERRVIRYATFDVSALGGSTEPTDAEIAARYKRDAAQYGASEKRTFTQLIVPTEAAAKSISQQVAAGASFDQVARNAGLRTATLKDQDRKQVQDQSSKEVADAYFGAAQGAITTPVRSSLGWQIARVDSINRVAARSLDQARPEITAAVREEKKAKGLADMASRIEDQIDGGATLAEIARDMKLTPEVTRPIVASGQVYGTTGETAPALLVPALATAFQMDEGDPEVAPIDNGQKYLLYEVSDITPSAAAPLAEIRNDVIAAWRKSQGAKDAQAAADRVLARVKAGKSLAAAVAEEKTPLPAVDSLNVTREELARMRDQRVPPPLALMFSMAQGTAKKLNAGGQNGWFVVDLDSIKVDPIAKDDPLIAQARAQLGPILGQEYADQLRLAIRNEIGVERNQAGIDAVRKQLAGGN